MFTNLTQNQINTKQEVSWKHAFIDHVIILSMFSMKRNFKHLWSTITPISTKRTITSQLVSLNTKRTRHMMLEIQFLVWDRHKDVREFNLLMTSQPIAGVDPGVHPARAPPLKLEKIWFFGLKSWFFTRNTPKMFTPPSTIGKNMIFWRKIVIFHTK